MSGLYCCCLWWACRQVAGQALLQASQGRSAGQAGADSTEASAGQAQAQAREERDAVAPAARDQQDRASARAAAAGPVAAKQRWYSAGFMSYVRGRVNVWFWPGGLGDLYVVAF